MKMKNQKGTPSSSPAKSSVRPHYVGAVVALISFSAFFTLVGFSYLFSLTNMLTYEAVENSLPSKPQSHVATPFPFGVNPYNKTITENPEAETFLNGKTRTATLGMNSRKSWFGSLLGKLALMDWYQNIASPTGRVLVVESGERKEEVASHFGKILGWSAEQKKSFLALVASSSPELSEGKFFPSTYMVARDATPEAVAPLVTERFKDEVASRYQKSIQDVVPLHDTLVIASLLEREAYDYDDMRFISGVIWNRLFKGMSLQIDATLQYAKANKNGGAWWPQALPADKNIASVFNTYQNKGLPPEPIANPSLDAILAALNPRSTDCLFYFHDARGGFHCTATYEEHVSLLKEYYGRGK